MHLLTFLLDHPDENLDSSIDLFNLPSTQLVSGYKGEDLFIHAFLLKWRSLESSKPWKTK